MKVIGVALFALGLSSSSFAHFIWAEMPKPGSRDVTLYLAEKPGDDILPVMKRLAPKVKFLGRKAGSPTVGESLLSYPMTQSAPAVLAYIPYGVIDRGGKVYGLDYYAKAVSTPTDAAKSIGKGFEIVAKLGADAWEVSTLVDGKPAADAQVVLEIEGKEVKGELGKPLQISLAIAPSAIAVRAVREVSRKGTMDGKSFETVKEWTSLLLPAAGKVTSGSDAEAYRALEAAVESRETLRGCAIAWKVPFGATNGTDTLKGTVAWEPKGMPEIAFGGSETSYTKHVRGQVQSMFMHRMGRNFWEGDGRYPITWTNDVNALGRKVVVGDAMKSSYRLKDGQIREVVRTMGKELLTLEILDTRETPSGRYLSTRFRSIGKDAVDGKPLHDLIYRDEFRLENGEWLPTRRRVEGKAEGQAIVMEVSFGSYRNLDETVKNDRS